MKFEKINPDFNWQKTAVEDTDFNKQSKTDLLLMLQQVYLIREFETALLKLKNSNLVHGPVHSSIGQESAAVGAASAVLKTDLFSGTHRAHHQYLAKGLKYHTLPEYNPVTQKFPQKMQDIVNTLMAEIMGLSPGCCGGRGGSMHLYNKEIGIAGTNAIVGGGIPVATGIAFARKYRNQDDIIISFFSDGAANQGAFHEALNLAGLWKLPIIYFIENNLYAVATGTGSSSSVPEFSVRAAAYNMHATIVDGMDPVAVKAVVENAAAQIRNGSGPYIIEAMTYRYYHHAGDIPGSFYSYRSKEEEEKWKQRDPVLVFPKKLIDLKLVTEKENSVIRESISAIIQTAVDFCTEPDSSTGKRSIKPELLPDPASLTKGQLTGDEEFDSIVFSEGQDFQLTKSIKYVDSIVTVTNRWMEKEPGTFVIGEEVANFGGGAYQATKGLLQKFPGRILNTPISEAGFSGLACGAAIDGLKPIVEIMFPDFVLVAADQIFNQICKLTHIYNGRIKMPLVMRTRISIGCGYGGQHSMDPAGLFALFPGWRVVAPSTPFDYIGLFNSAMQSNGPVLVIEHHELYNTTGLIPDNPDYFVKLGKAKIVNEGNDVTAISYSGSMIIAKQAVKELQEEGISVELIDLRTINPSGIDYETIGNSIKKTRTLMVFEQGTKSNSIGAVIVDECFRRYFDYFDCPAIRINGADVPNPVSRTLELAALPTKESIKEAAYRIKNRRV